MAQPMFVFDIAGTSLTVTPQDTSVVVGAALRTGLGEDDYSPLLVRAFSSVLGNPLASSVSKAQFDAAMRELLPNVAKWSDDRKEQMSYFLSNLFYAFDRDGLESVPTDEILVALVFLCGGSKTGKLAFSFALFDASDVDAIEQAELARLLSSLLTTLFALCAASNELSDDELDAAVHQCAVRTALEVYSDLGIVDGDFISFDMFGSWYNQFGFETIQWLELLDLNKWPAAASVRARPPQSDVRKASPTERLPEDLTPAQAQQSKKGLADGKTPVISFGFPAPFAANVSITERDVAKLAQVLNLTDLHTQDPTIVSRVFMEAAEEGTLERSSFDDCVRLLVPFEQLIKDAALDPAESLQVSEELTARFACFFAAFERFAGQGANADELAAGFSLLCKGSKSDKLAHAWEVIADGGSGRLGRRGLWRFLRSFLQMLMAVSSQVRDLSPEELAATADSGAVWTAALVFDEADRQEDATISFDEFAEWYTTGGFKSASWFELLDLKKWVITGEDPLGRDDDEDEDDDEEKDESSEEDDSDEDDEEYVPEDSSDDDDDEEEMEDEEYPSDDEDDEVSEEESEDDEPSAPVVFSFQLTAQGHCLYVTSADSASVMRVVALSSLFEMSCDELHSALAADAHVDPATNLPMLGMAGYNRALRQLLPGVTELQDPNALKFLTTALANVFFAFVPVGGDAAPLDELATGLSLFVQGSKSAKLQHAFALFDHDNDEMLGADELQRFLGAVLAVLFACARQTAKLPPDQSRALCGVATDVLASRIASEYGKQTGGLVSFEDFGAWYNAEGCDVAPWLELLDLKKWQFSKTADGEAAANLAAVRSDEVAAAVEAAEARVATAQTAAAAAAQGWAVEAEDDDSSDDSGIEDDDDDDEDDESEVDDEDEDAVEDEAVTSQFGVADPMRRAALYGMGADSARFSFALMDAIGEPSNLTLRLSDADVAALKQLVTKTGLSTRPAAAVCGPMLDAARDGLLAKKAFDGVVRALVPSETLTAEDRSKFSVLLSAIFYNFEATSESSPTNGNGSAGGYTGDSANALELAVGMSLLCAGDKSSKLNYAWRVIDLDDDGLLNRAELLFFLRAFVRMLLALSFEASELGPVSARQAATNMASWLSGTVIARYGDAAGRVSFDAFAQWYHDGFHQVAPWLELLDLKKWVL